LTRAVLAALANVSTINQEIRVWFPQRHDALKAMIDYTIAKDEETLALIAADQKAHPLR
jgi:hypothetical protein